jgi:RNA polymerase sigma factor (sigma-70 family)
MVARHGAAVLRVANQFSLCHDDALDAYQRAFEIYLRKLDTVDPATEGAWLRVVVKHEAMAIRRGRLDSVDREDVDLDSSVHSGLREVDDEVAGGERIDRSVEALRALKPDEARALLLKAEGLSYQEIGKHFGWSYTKVNRSITEGRARFLKVFTRLEEGEECETHADALSALAAGSATSAQVVSIRPHLRHCATCRAAVRDMRFSRTRRLALLLPLGWFTRLVSRSDVALYATSGGGRFGPAAAVLGICLSSVGAGAACVMSGALPAPPLIAHLQSKPEARAPVVKKVVAKRKVSSPARVAQTTPTSTPYAYATPAPTVTVKPQRVKMKTVRAKVAKRKVTLVAKRAAGGEFGFEGKGGSAAAPPPAPVASAASAGGGSGWGSGSGGGGGGGAKASSSTGGEFSFEGGG